MALPINLNLVTVHGRFLDTVITNTQLGTQTTGAPSSGYVAFRMPYALRDHAEGVILGPGTFRATLDKNGEFQLDLPASDDPDVTPTGWAYAVQVYTSSMQSKFNCVIPMATVGVLEFTDITPIQKPTLSLPQV